MLCYCAYMKRITVSLPDNVEAAVRREARRRGVAVSEIVRERIEGSPKTEAGRRIPFAAIGRSGKSDTARNIDTILAQEWTPSPKKADAGSR